jgi:hypothetical protein
LPFPEAICRIFILLFYFTVTFDLTKEELTLFFGLIKVSFEVTLISIFLLLLLFDWLLLLFYKGMFFLLTAFALELFLL